MLILNILVATFQIVLQTTNIYPIIENIEWTDGFYSGLIALAYEYTKDEKYLKVLNKHVESFYNRISKQIEVDYRDLGDFCILLHVLQLTN